MAFERKVGSMAFDREFCDKDCNNCPIINHHNSRMVSLILNRLHFAFGPEAYKIVQENCPNLTCCSDCHIDDFGHVSGCEVVSEALKQQKKKKRPK